MADATIFPLDPNSDYLLPVAVSDPASLAPVTTATVTASVMGPGGASVATGIACPHVGQGVYKLPWRASYTVDSGGVPIVGTYEVEFVAVGPAGQRELTVYYAVAPQGDGPPL